MALPIFEQESRQGEALAGRPQACRAQTFQARSMKGDVIIMQQI